MKNPHVPYRFLYFSFPPKEAAFVAFAFGEIIPPEKGKYGEVVFPDGCNVLLRESDYQELLSFRGEWEKETEGLI